MDSRLIGGKKVSFGARSTFLKNMVARGVITVNSREKTGSPHTEFKMVLTQSEDGTHTEFKMVLSILFRDGTLLEKTGGRRDASLHLYFLLHIDIFSSVQ